jgi:hypothetical protein
MARQKADIVTISNDHPHHSYLDAVENGEGVPRVLRGPGQYETAGFYIIGIGTSLGEFEGERKVNTVFTFQAEDLTLCHLGDLNQRLSPSSSSSPSPGESGGGPQWPVENELSVTVAESTKLAVVELEGTWPTVRPNTVTATVTDSKTSLSMVVYPSRVGRVALENTMKPIIIEPMNRSLSSSLAARISALNNLISLSLLIVAVS